MALQYHSDRKVAVGGLIVASVIMAMLAIIVVSGQEGFLAQKFELRTTMAAVNGLQAGAPVWLAGYPVGSVTDILYIPDETNHGTKLEVRMKVKKEYQHLIRTDSRARIGTLGLLGDKYVALSLGSQDSSELKEGAYIISSNPVDFEELLSHGVGVVDDLTKTVKDVREITRKINEGEGTIGLLVNNPHLFFDFRDMFIVLTKISNKIERNEGTIGRLFNDPSLYEHLDSSLQAITALTDTLKSGEGTLKLLLKDPTLYNNMVSSVSKIDSLVYQIQQGRGTTGALISNQELYLRLVHTVGSLDTLLTEIKNNPSKYLKIKMSLF